MPETTANSEQIKIQLRNFLQEAMSIQQKLKELKYPKTTLVGEVVDSARQSLIPSILGDTAGEVARSFGLPGTLARKYTKIGTRNYLRQNKKTRSVEEENQFSFTIDAFADKIIGFVSQISVIKPSLRTQGNSQELLRRFAKAKSLQKSISKISSIVSSLNQVLSLCLIYNKDIEGYLAEAQRHRFNDAYGVLFGLESHLRVAIENCLAKISPDWWTERVPSDVRKNAEDRKQKNELSWPWSSGSDLHPLHYVDFRDYEKIIVRKDNWGEVFEKIFERKEYVISKFMELDPIRNAIAHSRKINQKELDKLKLYSEEILGALNRIS